MNQPNVPKKRQLASARNVVPGPQETASKMTKKFWVAGIGKHHDGERQSSSVDLDKPGAQLVYERENLRHMFASANSSEVTAPNWTAFAGIAVALGVSNIIQLEEQLFSVEMTRKVRPDAYAVAGGHVYLGFAELEDWGAAAKLLLKLPPEKRRQRARRPTDRGKVG